MGGHRVPAGLDDHDADRGEARRPLRAKARPPGGPGRLPRRLGAVRAQPEHARADRLPGDPGVGRRRSAGQHAGRDRRRRLSARTRPLLRADGRRVRRLDGGRPADRRAVGRPPLVALDLLRQPADRDRRVRRPPGRSARPLPDDSPRDRLRGHGTARGRPHRARPVHEPRRHDLPVVVGADGDPARNRRGALGRVRRRRTVRAGAARPARTVPQPRIRGRQRRRVHRRDGPVRLGHLSAALPAGGEGLGADRVRPADAAADGGRAGQLDRQRAADHPLRTLQGLPDRRHRADGGRPAAALAARRRDGPGRRRPLHARRRARARLRHAGARARRPERRRLREPRGGDVDGDAVPVDGWGDRRPPLRGDLRQPALVAPLGEASAGSRGLPAGPPRPAADRRAAGGDPRPVRGGLCRVR